MSRSNYLLVPLIILIVLSVLYISHYFIYSSIAYFFSITSKGSKVILALVLFLLPISFIALMILARWSDNYFLRALYFSSGLWLGVSLTLITFFAFTWAAWGATRLVTHSPSRTLFGLATVLLVGLWCGYGVWNAYHPRIEHVRVRMKNLPSDWRGKKLVQLSDVHLGHILGTAFLRDIVQKVNTLDPVMVLITGDLFDGMDGRLDELVVPLNDLRAPWGIYFVTGNHETYLGTDRAFAALRKTKVRILHDEMVVVNGLQIIGIDFPEREFSKDIAAVIQTLPEYNRQMPSLLLYHSPTQVEQAKAAGIRLQLSGHTHHGQIFPIQIISRLIYQKYYTGLHVEGDYTIYTSSGAGTWGPTMRTGNHPEITVIHLE
jgi:hypothetical protein